jgi:hypothetical protein
LHICLDFLNSTVSAHDERSPAPVEAKASNDNGLKNKKAIVFAFPIAFWASGNDSGDLESR